MLSLIAARASLRLLDHGTHPLRTMRAVRAALWREPSSADGRPAERAVLAASRRAFRRMQKAWDRRDLIALQALTLAPVFDDLRQTLDAVDAGCASQPATRTSIEGLDARLLGVDPVGEGLWLASVEFSGRTRERGRAEAEPFRELWMFSGQAQGRGHFDWRLARVQPLY